MDFEFWLDYQFLYLFFDCSSIQIYKYTCWSCDISVLYDDEDRALSYILALSVAGVG